MKLNRTPNPLDRNARNGENDNWDIIEGEVRKVGDIARGVDGKANQALKLANQANEKSNEANSKADSTQQQLDDIILDDGTGNAEVIQARGGEPLLKDRLNKTDAQLSETVDNLGTSPAGTQSVWGELTGREVSVEWFGAVGDGVTDDTNAWIATKNYIEAINERLIFYVPPHFRCYIPNGVDLFTLQNINISGRVIGDGVSNNLTVGVRSQVVFPFKGNFHTVTGLTLKVQGIKNGEVSIYHADRMLLWADSSDGLISSLAYSTFHLGTLDTIDFDSVGEGAWINENKFFGGRITNLSIKGSYKHNHNHFYSPTLEGSTINIESGSTNYLFNCRLEGQNSINFGEDSWGNYIIKTWENTPGSYLRGTGVNKFTDLGIGNVVTHIGDAYHHKNKILKLNRSNMGVNIDWIVKNDKGSLSVTKDGRYKNIFESGLIPLQANMGLHLKSDVSIWRVYINFYDSDKNLIEVESPDAISTGSLTWNEALFAYNNSSNAKELYVALFRSQVASFVKISVQSHHSLLSPEFEYLEAYLNTPKSEDIYIPDISNRHENFMSTIPSEGAWEIGDRAYYTEPESSGYVGAVYTLSGWKNFGAIV